MADNRVTEQILDLIGDTTVESLPPDALECGRAGLLDTIGVALAGSVELGSRQLRRAANTGHGDGDATVLGTNMRDTPAATALVNGFAAHALDYDDTQHRVGTHMSAPVVAAALAVAETEGSSGRALLASYVVGFEVGARLGRAGNLARHLNRRGIHATGFLGHLGAVAAAARLMGLKRDQVDHALGLAAGHAAGLVRSFGTTGKAQNSGNAAHNAVLCARLAAAGASGPTGILDGDRSVLAASGFEPDPATFGAESTAAIGQEWEICHNTLKQFACAGWRNPIVEAGITLSRDHGVTPGDAATIHVWASPNVAHLPNHQDPTTGLESKFSAQHAFAVGLCDHAGGIVQFSDDRVTDRRISELRRRVALDFDRELRPYQIRVELNTTEGRQLVHNVADQKGSPTNPLSWDELLVKFGCNASTVLPESHIHGLSDALADIADVADVRELAARLRP